MQIKPYAGGSITEPGIYSGIDIEAYHSDPNLFDRFAISSSGLRSFIERPSLYWAFSPYNPNRFPRPESSAMDFGKAAHHLLLEGEAGFEQKFVISPYPDFRSKEAREWRDAQRLSGKTIITDKDLSAIQFIRDSLARHPIIQGGILEGVVETSLIARVGSIYLRARPDVVPAHAGDFADLKTTTSIRFDDLERSIFSYGYHIQAAVVRMVAQSVMGDGFEFGGFAFVFVEKTPPYDVRIVQLRPEVIDLGEKQVRRALTDLEACLARNEWPGEEGFAPSLGFIGLPAWGKARVETELALKEALA